MDKTCNFNFGTMNSKAKTSFFFEQSSGPKIKSSELEREKNFNKRCNQLQHSSCIFKITLFPNYTLL